MCKDTVANLKRRIKQAKEDGVDAGFISRLEKLLAEETAAYLRSRQPGSHQSVAEDLREQAEAEEDE